MSSEFLVATPSAGFNVVGLSAHMRLATRILGYVDRMLPAAFERR